MHVYFTYRNTGQQHRDNKIKISYSSLSDRENANSWLTMFRNEFTSQLYCSRFILLDKERYNDIIKGTFLLFFVTPPKI